MGSDLCFPACTQLCRHRHGLDGGGQYLGTVVQGAHLMAVPCAKAVMDTNVFCTWLYNNREIDSVNGCLNTAVDCCVFIW